MLKNRGHGGRAEISRFERNFVRTHDQPLDFSLAAILPQNLFAPQRTYFRIGESSERPAEAKVESGPKGAARHQARPQPWVRPADHFAARKSVNFWPCGAIMKTSNFAGAVALAFFETM